MTDPKIAPPELETPSLGQSPPKPTVHHLVADDLVIDLAELFEKLKRAASTDPPPSSAEHAMACRDTPLRDSPGHAEPRLDDTNLPQTT